MIDKTINFLTGVFIIVFIIFAYASSSEHVLPEFKSFVLWSGVIFGALAIIFGFIHDQRRIKKEETAALNSVDDLIRKNKELTEEIASLKETIKKDLDKELVDKA